MKWLLVLAIYTAPADAVDWNGPWVADKPVVMDDQFDSAAECRTFAVQLIGRMHQGMLAPMRYRCVEMEDVLPEGAPR